MSSVIRSLLLVPFWVLLSFSPVTVVWADGAKQAVPVDELRTFAEVFQRVRQEYVEEVSDEELLQNAIQGMLSGLDPHSTFLKKEGFSDMRESTSGEFGGLGMEVGMEDGFVRVIAPIDDTPAQRAGMVSGDLVIRIDEKPVKGLSLTEAVDLMRGKIGTDVVLTVVRKGQDKPFNVTLTRAVIKVTSVKTKLLEKGLGYVRISQFQMRTGEDLLKKIQQLQQDSQGSLKGLILDLRNNPGGVLTAAVQVSDAFLNDGLIVFTQGRDGKNRLEFNAKPGDVLSGAPVVILINEGSASASEIVSGALKQHNRALVVGRTTFGKGSVQSLMPLRGGSAIKLTTARYYTPNGDSIQNKGIEPDIVLETVKVEKLTSEFKRLKEKDLNGHLDNDNESGEESKEGDTPSSTEPETFDAMSADQLLEKDYELFRALDLLKAYAHSSHLEATHADKEAPSMESALP